MDSQSGRMGKKYFYIIVSNTGIRRSKKTFVLFFYLVLNSFGHNFTSITYLFVHLNTDVQYPCTGLFLL